MIITNNLSAIRIQDYLKTKNQFSEKSINKLSSGYQINQAADNAAGLYISEKMRVQIRGLNQSSLNGQDGISLIQTAEGGTNEVHSILQRMRELSIQAANDTNTDLDRASIQEEINNLSSEINHIAKNTQFNTINLLDGSIAAASSSGSAATGDIFKQRIDWSGTEFWLYNGHGMRIDYFDGNSNQSIELKAVSGGWDYKNGIVIEPAGGGGLTDMVNFFNSILDYPVNRGGKLEHFLDRFYFSTDPSDDHVLMLTAKDSQFKINNVSCLAGSQISNGGPLELVSVTGVPGNELTLQIGSQQGQYIKLAVDRIDAISLGIYGLNVMNHIQADDAISRLDTAIDHVSNVRSKLGASQNRLEAAIRNIDNTSENTSIAESRIRDTDIAKEMVAYSTNHILTQAAHAMLAQAQKQPQQALMLLQ